MKRQTMMAGDSSPQKRGSNSRLGCGTNLRRLRCLNCGQIIFVAIASEPPDTCRYCDDMTTWQTIEG